MPDRYYILVTLPNYVDEPAQALEFARALGDFAQTKFGIELLALEDRAEFSEYRLVQQLRKVEDA